MSDWFQEEEAQQMSLMTLKDLENTFTTHLHKHSRDLLFY